MPMLKEAQEHMIDLYPEDPGLIEHMMLYIYTQKYPIEVNSTPGQVRSTLDLLFDAKLYAVADKYDVPRLKDDICCAFESLLKTVGSLFSETPASFMPELIAIVYGTTPDSDRGLRDKLYVFIETHRLRILGKESVQRCAKEFDGFAADLLRIFLMDTRTHGVYWCSSCSKYRGITKDICDFWHGVNYS